LGDFTGISYTQWEIYLAFHHRCNRLVFVAAKGAPRSPTFGMPEMAEEQVKHLERLKKTGEHREWFEDQRDLALKVITSIVRHGLAPLTAQREASEQAKEAGRKEAAQLVSEIAEGVRHPDRAYVSADDPAGVEVFLRAVDTAALKRELDRRAALEIAHEHRAKNCARQRQSRLRPRICASWLWLSLPWATIRRRSQRRNVRRRRPSKT
jgi:hypothetical protein